ncbi:MAG: lysophospholipid acyltransferase family protein [Pseudobdellovibrio sp.]
MPYKALIKKINPALKSAYIFQRMNYFILKSYFSKDLVHVKKAWAQDLLNILNSNVTIIGKPVHKGPLLLIGNHISYADIPVIMSIVPQVSFLSKSEVALWPIIGAATRRAQTIFVKRGSPESRAQSKKIIEKSLTKDKALIAAFPAGTTSMKETIPWRYGLFETAFVRKIKIQPFRLRYAPQRKVAFIDDDDFLPHLHQLAKQKKIHVVIEFHEPVEVLDPIKCSQRWQKWTQEFSVKK